MWIGGAPGAGKTTVAVRLARRWGLRFYGADTRTWEHRDRAVAAGSEAARRWEALSPADRWERASAADMLEMSLHHERGPMVIGDLESMSRSLLIVAEGSSLPASAVTAGIIEPTRAVWLLPTPEFQSARLAERDVTGGPARLYRRLGRVIEDEAVANGVPTIRVDGSRSVAEMVDQVEAMFGDALAAGPVAVAPDERQGLLREMNAATVAQVRGYFARPWAEGDADPVTRMFVCECGEPSCDLEVRVTVRSAATGPVLAPGHTATGGSCR